MAYFKFTGVPLGSRGECAEFVCRYCGERMIVEKGEMVNTIVGPDGAGGTHVVGVAHVTCSDPNDDFSEGTLCSTCGSELSQEAKDAGRDQCFTCYVEHQG